MGVIAKLTWGARTFDLNDGTTFSLMEGFAPPSVNRSLNIGSGTSANRTRGGEVVGVSYQDRAFSFSVIIRGTSDAEAQNAAGNLQRFLNLAYNKRDGNKLYFEYKANDNVTFKPLWGQDQWLRYEVKTGDASIDNQWYRGQKKIVVPVSLLLGPLATGIEQRVGTATGGILEDTVGSPDGISRGLLVPKAATNIITNPIFGHSTWDTGWSVSNAALLKTENTDPEFILFGSSSAKLVNTDTSAARLFYQTFTAADTTTHVFSCYAKLPDGGVVSNTICNLRYSSTNITTTYTAVGDGWYRLTGTAAGDTNPASAGLYLQENYSVYLDGFLIEDANYENPLCYGDQLGCSWSGTAHESTSTRVVGSYRIDGSYLDSKEGTVRIVWKAPFDYDTYADGLSLYLFDSGNTRLLFNSTSDYFSFGDGTNTITSNTTFSRGDIIVFHCVYAPGRLEIYVDGAGQTGTTYNPPAAPSYVYLGCDTSSANQIRGTFLDFTIWGEAMTATEVSNDYGNVQDWVSGGDGYGQRLNAIPWLWTKDGDDVLDNHDDSADDNFAFVGGVPGSVPADSLIEIDYTTTPSINYAWVGVAPHEYAAISQVADSANVDGSYYWSDRNASADATNSGGGYSDIVTSATPELTWDSGYAPQNIFLGETHYFIRGSATAADFQLTPRFLFGGGTEIVGKTVTLTDADATERLFYIGKINTYTRIHELLFDDENPHISWKFDFFSASSATFHLDYLMLAPGRLAKVETTIADGKVRLRGRRSVVLNSGVPSQHQPVLGDEIEFYPDKLNFVRLILGDSGDANDISDTGTLAIWIYPRWEIV